MADGMSHKPTTEVVKPTKKQQWHASTLSVHADDALNSATDVAPPLHVSTTFRYNSNPDELIPGSDLPKQPRLPHDPSTTHIYSRLGSPNTSRLETLLTSLLHGPAITYSSGLAAFHALLVHLRPRTVVIGEGYHGCHGVLSLYRKLTGCDVLDLSKPETWSGLGKGDLVHIETPLNPTGEASDIEFYARKAHEVGAYLSVDSTFAPPPLQDPFVHGADYVLHSGTKYFGGHSDMLCGVLAVNTNEGQGDGEQGSVHGNGNGEDGSRVKGLRPQEGEGSWVDAYWELWNERVFLGSAMGSLEGWLGVRSLRTLELRVMRQSQNAEGLVRWLDGLLKGDSTSAEADIVSNTVAELQHSSLQGDAFIKRQMPNGPGPVFSIVMKNPTFAKRLPSKLHLFHHATSLGGVESLIEWRRMSDDTVDERLLRVSIGVENLEDLKTDMLEGFKALSDEAGGSSKSNGTDALPLQ